MNETLTQDELTRAGSMMRDCAMESAVGYATALAHATGMTNYDVLHSAAYRTFADAWRDMYLAMIVRDPDYDGARDRAAGDVGRRAREDFFRAIMERDPIDKN